MKHLKKTAFDESKAQALAEYLDVDVNDVDTDYDSFDDGLIETVYIVDGNTYRVLTEDEAHTAFEDYLKCIIEEIGFKQTFGSYLDNALNAGVDGGKLRDFWYNDYLDYAYDIEDEDDEYGNRLIKECIENDLIDEDEVEDGEYTGDEDLCDLLAECLTDNLDGYYAEELLGRFDDEFALKVIEDYGAIDYSALVDWSLTLNNYGNWLSPIDGKTMELDGYLGFWVSD